jgi:hypothetical protein
MNKKLKVLLLFLGMLILLVTLLFVPLPVVYDFNLTNATWELNEAQGNKYKESFVGIENIPFNFRIKFGYKWQMGGDDGANWFGGFYCRNMLNELYIGRLTGTGIFALPKGLSIEKARLFNERCNWLASSLQGKHNYEISHSKLIIYANRCQLTFIRQQDNHR